MTTCEICTLSFPGDHAGAYPDRRCPNGWRPDKQGVLRERGPGKHEAARGHLEAHRAAQAGTGARPARS